MSSRGKKSVFVESTSPRSLMREHLGARGKNAYEDATLKDVQKAHASYETKREKGNYDSFGRAALHVRAWDHAGQPIHPRDEFHPKDLKGAKAHALVDSGRAKVASIHASVDLRHKTEHLDVGEVLPHEEHARRQSERAEEDARKQRAEQARVDKETKGGTRKEIHLRPLHPAMVDRIPLSKRTTRATLNAAVEAKLMKRDVRRTSDPHMKAVLEGDAMRGRKAFNEQRSALYAQMGRKPHQAATQPHALQRGKKGGTFYLAEGKRVYVKKQ